MPEKQEDDQVRDIMATLLGEAERIWQDRQCLPMARFWKVAFNLCIYDPAEQRHVAACGHCQKREQEVRASASFSGKEAGSSEKIARKTAGPPHPATAKDLERKLPPPDAGGR